MLSGVNNTFSATCLDPDEPEHLLVPIAQSASDLLCHGDLGLVKRHPGEFGARGHSEQLISIPTLSYLTHTPSDP